MLIWYTEIIVQYEKMQKIRESKLKKLRKDTETLKRQFEKLGCIVDEYAWEDLFDEIEGEIEKVHFPEDFARTLMVGARGMDRVDLAERAQRDLVFEKNRAFALAFISRKKNHSSVHAAKILSYVIRALFGKPHSNLVADIVNILFETSYTAENIDRHGKSVIRLEITLPFAP